MRWTVPAAGDAAQSATLAQAAGCPEAIARLLIARGYTDPAAVRGFFEPTLADLLDPLTMLGMARAVERIRAAVHDGERILIYGDYDVDGTFATVLLKTALERLGTASQPAAVSFHVPHRLREGYGMQTNILAQAAESGVTLVISVDTGIRAFAAADEAKALGLDLIVTDHHLPDGVAGIPEAVAVVNPAQPGCPYPNKSLCGAGVAFQLAHALLLAAADTQEKRDRVSHVLVPSFLKLVAIATIADSVPLTGENRAMVALGLRELRNPIQPGLRALMQVAELPPDRAPTASEVGFRLAPRINAAGRMDVASDVVELFLTRDPARARELALKLDGLNQDRRATEAKALEAIELQLLSMRDPAGLYAPECIVLGHPEWHRGVLGILASRVVDRTGRPAVIMTDENGAAHGSGRSIPGFHLLDALTAVHGPDALFHRFGGHAHAVGFSLPTTAVDLLRSRMKTHSAGALTAEILAPELRCDAELQHHELARTLCAWLARCAPFGIGNPEPIFVTRGLLVDGPIRTIKDRHICLPIATSDGTKLSAMGWSRTTSPDWPAHCRALALVPGARVDAVFRLRENLHPQYGGLELELLDVVLSAPVPAPATQEKAASF